MLDHLIADNSLGMVIVELPEWRIAENDANDFERLFIAREDMPTYVRVEQLFPERIVRITVPLEWVCTVDVFGYQPSRLHRKDCMPYFPRANPGYSWRVREQRYLGVNSGLPSCVTDV